VKVDGIKKNLMKKTEEKTVKQKKSGKQSLSQARGMVWYTRV